MTDKDLSKEIERALEKLVEMVRGLPQDRQDALQELLDALAEREVEDYEDTPLRRVQAHEEGDSERKGPGDRTGDD